MTKSTLKKLIENKPKRGSCDGKLTQDSKKMKKRNEEFSV